jgi:hypothetical protein
MADKRPDAPSGKDPRRLGPGAGPVLVCIGLFAALGGVVEFATRTHGGRPGLYLSQDNLPPNVDNWRLRGSEPGWMKESYPVGSVVYRYEKPGGSAVLVTGGVSQEHDKTFANIDTTHLQRGHTEVARVPVTVGPGPKGEKASGEVVVYSATAAEPGFAYFILYYDGQMLTTSAARQKVSLNMHRVIGRPVPWEIMHFMRPMGPDEDHSAVAREVARFATGMLGNMEGLWQRYVGSVPGH